MSETTGTIVSDWRWEKHAGSDRARQEPIDGEPQCNYCNSMRYILDPQGKMKPCPLCRVAEKWRGKGLDAYSSDSGKAKTQTFKTFKTPTPAMKNLKLLVVEWAVEPHGWIFLYGAPGNGKTHLVAAAYNQTREDGRKALFTSAPDFIASLKSLFDRATRDEEHETYQARLSVYQRTEVLFLDDLGAERQTDWTDSVFFELLDYRYRNKLATMLSSNYDPQDKAHFDVRLISRWHDSAFSLVLRNTAPDYRQQRREAIND